MLAVYRLHAASRALRNEMAYESAYAALCRVRG